MAQCIDMSSDPSETKLIFEDTFAHDADNTRQTEWAEKYEEYMGVAPVTEDHPVVAFMDMLLVNPADGSVVQDADTNQVSVTSHFGRVEPVGANVYKAGEPHLIDRTSREPLENLDSWADYGLSEEVLEAFEDMLKRSGRRESQGRSRRNPE